MLYPDNWKLEEDEPNLSVTLESPHGSFLQVTSCQDSLESDFKKVVEAMHEEYDDIETDAHDLSIDSELIEGITQRFVCLDMVVTSHLLKLSSDGQNFIVQIQGEDRDMTKDSPIFEACLTSICQALQSGK